MKNYLLLPLVLIALLSACKKEEQYPTKLDLMTNFKDAETWHYTNIVFNGEEVSVSSDSCYLTYKLALGKDMTFVEYNDGCPSDPAQNGTFTISEEGTKWIVVTGLGEIDSLTIVSIKEQELQLIKHLKAGPTVIDVELTLEPF